MAGAAVVLATAASRAQYGTPATQAPLPLTCADFHQNPDGSWSPNHPVSINGVTMGTGVAFTEGVSFGGANIAAALDRQCR
jgi:hypothetical protein